MPHKIYRLRLEEAERDGLKSLANLGRASARKQTHARILLLCDEGREGGGRTDAEIADALDIGVATVARVRRRCVEEGVEAALNRKPQRNRRPRLLDGDAEARLVATACGEPPEGRAKWTLRLLADRLVELEVVESVSIASCHPSSIAPLSLSGSAHRVGNRTPWMKRGDRPRLSRGLSALSPPRLDCMRTVAVDNTRPAFATTAAGDEKHQPLRSPPPKRAVFGCH